MSVERGLDHGREPAELHAVTRAVSTVGDLLDALGPDGFLWADHGAGIATSGVAATVTAADAKDAIGAIATDDEVEGPGTGPVAVGALPFDPSGDALLTIPSRVVGRDAAGNGWITHIGPGLEPAPSPSPHPTRFEVAAVQSRTWWQAAVEDVLDRIRRGELAKAVLAREVTVDADEPFDLRAVVRRLRSQQPGCVLYAHRGLVGATPEILVRRLGRLVESRPMAGTAPGSERLDVVARLAASGKDAREHRFVVDAVRETLAPLTTRLDVPDEPEIEQFGALAHLVTPIRGRLRGEDPPTALEIARQLHPSPAVGGTPTGAALDAIRRIEGFDRGSYAGPIGWVDGRGDGAFAIALRGAEIAGSHAVLRAGAGIVAGSDPDAEWAETVAKLEPMLRALVAP